MNRYNISSLFFIILGVLVIVGSSFVIVSYVSDILTGIVEFITTTDYSRLQQCGITLPDQFTKLKADFTTVILPFMYAGFPILLIVLSVLMFMAGAHHNRAKMMEEKKTPGMKSDMTGAVRGSRKAKKEIVQEEDESEEEPEKETEDEETEEVEEKPVRKRR